MQVTSAGSGSGTFVLYGSTDCSGGAVFQITDNKCSGLGTKALDWQATGAPTTGVILDDYVGMTQCSSAVTGSVAKSHYPTTKCFFWKMDGDDAVYRKFRCDVADKYGFTGFSDSACTTEVAGSTMYVDLGTCGVNNAGSTAYPYEASSAKTCIPTPRTWGE